MMNYSLPVLSGMLRRREISARELTENCFAAIDEKDGSIGAFLTLDRENALCMADAVDRKSAVSPLAGIPVGIKDNICTKGLRTTCASKMLADFVPPYDAAVCEKLHHEDMMIVGKCNMDEFAMGSTTENSCFHPTKNPVNPAYIPGGSSGGSAAAVAGGMIPCSLGSDTGGSVRQPASFCGIVGMKPTYGRVSRRGLVAFASSFDQIGTLTRDVASNAMLLSAIAGQDSRDMTSLPQSDNIYADYLKKREQNCRGFRIGLCEDMLSVADTAVKEAVLSAARQYETYGFDVDFVSLPNPENALSAYYVLSGAEASSNLARYDGIRYGHRTENSGNIDDLIRYSRSEGFGKEVKRRILLGTFALSAGYADEYYRRASAVRDRFRMAFTDIFTKYDVLLAPTVPTAAWKLGTVKTPVSLYQSDICTVPANLAGLPSLSVPCGKDTNGLPIGLQLIGNAFSESLLYAVSDIVYGKAEM